MDGRCIGCAPWHGGLARVDVGIANGLAVSTRLRASGSALWCKVAEGRARALVSMPSGHTPRFWTGFQSDFEPDGTSGGSEITVTQRAFATGAPRSLLASVMAGACPEG